MAEENISKLEQLQNEREYEKVHEILTSSLQQQPENVDYLWRMARSCFDMADGKPNDATYKQKFITEGMKYATKALELDDKRYETNKWFAILTSSMGDYVSTKEKIGNAYKIKEHALKALEIRPDDPTTLHLLGRWCFGVANIGWMERKLASALFATPPSSSFEEALQYFLKAAEIEPTFARNLLFTGETYAALKNKDKAKEWYQKVVDLPVQGDRDRVLNEEAKSKIAKL